MKKSSKLLLIMIAAIGLYVFTQYIVFSIIDINIGANHTLAMTIVNVTYVLLSLVLPLVIIFGVKPHKALVRFAYGLIGFALANLVYHLVRHSILVGDASFPDYVVSNTFLIILTGVYFIIIGFMVYQMYLYWKHESNKFVKVNLVLIVVSLVYNLQVFSIMRYRYLVTASFSTLTLYSNVSAFVTIILYFLSALMVYALVIRNEDL